MIKETARVRVLAPYVAHNGGVLEHDQSIDFSDVKIFATPDQSVAIQGRPNGVIINEPHPLRTLSLLSKFVSPAVQDLYPTSSHPTHGTAASNPPSGPEFDKTIWPINIGEDPSQPCYERLGKENPQLEVSYLGHPFRNAINKLISSGRASVVLREFLDKHDRKIVYRDILFEPVYLSKLDSAESILFLELMVIENEGKLGKVKSRTPSLFRLSLANRSHTDGLVRVNQPSWHSLEELDKEERRKAFRRTAESLCLSKTFSSQDPVNVRDLVYLNEYIRQSYDFKKTDNVIKLPFDSYDDRHVTDLTAQIYDFVKSI